MSPHDLCIADGSHVHMATYKEMSRVARETIDTLERAEQRLTIARWVLMDMTAFAGKLRGRLAARDGLPSDLAREEQDVALRVLRVLAGEELALMDLLPEELRHARK